MPEAQAAALAASAAQELMRMNLGLAGVVIVALATYCWILHSQLRKSEQKRLQDIKEIAAARAQDIKECENARVADAKSVIDRVISMSERQAAVLSEKTSVMLAIKDGLDDVRSLVTKE
jgi:hypothetical protein